MAKAGFTLLELLVTISIIGILLAVGSVSFTSAQKKGRDARRLGDMGAIQKALEECFSLDTRYPGSLSYGNALNCPTSGTTVMGLVPADPKPGQNYTYTTGGTPPASYCLCAYLENSGSGNANNSGSGGNCSYGGSKNYFCVNNQQ